MRSVKNVSNLRRIFLLFLLFILFQAVLLAEYSSSRYQELSKTTIRNDTQKPIRYDAHPDRPGERLERKVIEPGQADHYPGDTALKLTFPRDGKPLLYRLNPGGGYFFQLDEQNKLDIYADIEKKADAEDAVPFVATPMDVVRKMLEMAHMDSKDVVYDLGCGDGRVVIMAAREFEASGVGIDIDDRRIKESRANAIAAGVEDRVEFRLQDVFQANISEATVVTLYMLTEINQRLCPQLEEQLKPGTIVITHSYPVPGWASKMIDFMVLFAADGEEHIIYLYQK